MTNRYIWFTYDFLCAPIAEKLQREGNDVLIAVLSNQDTGNKNKPDEEERRLSLGMGVECLPADRVMAFLRKVPEYERAKYRILTDFNWAYKYTEELSELGYWGQLPTKEDNEMERDRQKATEFIKKHYPKVAVAEKVEFKTVDEASTYLDSNDKLFVLKGNNADCLTVVPGSDAEQDPEGYREHLKGVLQDDRKDYESEGFILEEYIPNKIELTPQAIFVDGEPVCVDLDIELKREGASDTGIMTGASADLVFPLSKESRLYEIALAPIAEYLKRRKGIVIWDLSLLIDPKTNTPYAGEYCSNRFGWNCHYTELAHMDRVSDFYDALWEHRNPFEGMESYSASVRIFNHHRGPDRLPSDNLLITYKEPDYKHVWLMDAKKHGNNLVTSGLTEDVAVTTGCGPTPESAIELASMCAERFGFVDAYRRPRQDLLSEEYEGSMINRYKYAKQHGWF